MTKMTEARMAELAEVRANLTGDDFTQALREVREMVADGATYDPEEGWVW